ncbi:Class I glutamine amidotransferase-like protein [Rhizoctonia solani]|uniref:Class I glutamine amidotransferase-like protein n=1 Tax=Rhizoctonia solani TaxID=456999 RepID=A0A8H7H3S9_9AGAM|nr:Class I glutamine amidotransferase-like protein [Rhizoctonia solani]
MVSLRYYPLKFVAVSLLWPNFVSSASTPNFSRNPGNKKEMRARNEGPMELLGWLGKGSASQINPIWPSVPYEFVFDYIAESLEPISTLAGPSVVPSKTFDQVHGTQYDIILVPGGTYSHRKADMVHQLISCALNTAAGRVAGEVSPTIVNFVKNQNPGLKYLLSVCTGAWIVANAGVLEGKNATTNKAAFMRIKNETSTNINWIPKARWVVDGNTWTSSGVSAGADMAHAFMEFLVGDNFTTVARNIVEWRAAEQGDDPFAHEWGLA